jgi:YHS domain-containing protein
MNDHSLSPELGGHCPVAYFALDKPMAGDSRFASTHEGKLYYFVSAEAKNEFDRHPEKYLPAYGGLCAFGMSIDKEFPACPTNFKIIDGKLHLFLKTDDTDAKRLWETEDESKCLSNANTHWLARHFE